MVGSTDLRICRGVFGSMSWDELGVWGSGLGMMCRCCCC